MSGFESTTTIERPIPVTERDVFVIGPLYEPTDGMGPSIQGQFSARMVETLADYPTDVTVVSIVPAISGVARMRPSGNGWENAVAAIFTVTIEWAVQP